MNLAYPFNQARELAPNHLGQIVLVDESGKVLAHIPLTTAYGIAPEQECDLPEWCFVDGSGNGTGVSYGSGYGFNSDDGSGDGYGVVYGFGYGNGEGCGEE